MILEYTVSAPELEPYRAKSHDAGLDLKAAGDFDSFISPVNLLGTGVRVNIPQGYVGLLFGRSSLAKKHGVVLANSVGVIDAGYTGEIKAALVRVPGADFKPIEYGERFCQLVVLPLPFVTLQKVQAHLETERGDGGFGSSGAK